MAKVDWSAGIDSVSGALAKPSKSGQHSCSKMLLGTHRIAATTSSNCNRIYLRKKVKRSTPVSSDETLARTRFGAISKKVHERKKNLSYVATDTANFNAQKESGYKTLYQYLWHVCAEEYDQAQG
ncbi:MAG: hypothetical protein IJT12_03810 [Paludibacteraceae bacterium]|nr:hypothetical protein [Paludibacteraceae bacterium]